ncbi:MarR family transcriptional regulator [Herbiconiux sp. CPCC 203407]|uniref:MarR family transcriptional regulator n=1 Tax=Herbiconiux oxytropis TaxID=2970915 RepID=A0AA41XHA3_9MICO|nr:MarR family transcriptional regulator [Herbiconiux oxytropis]MCS5721337.1 MarR family transcriptional regulator [Herbiconiux oxytropis]MCS5726224.1 MarR family transcriptional regulator [Herbiconiux oxytropis]
MNDSAVSLDARQFSVWADFVLAHTRVMRLIEHSIRKEAGLTWAQYDVLYNLNAEPGSALSIGDLTRTLLYSSGSASKLVAAMQRGGLIEREQSTDDRRVILVRPTAEGSQAFERATAEVLRVVREEFAAHLSDEELPVVAAFLRRLREQDPKLRRPPYDLPVALDA